MIDIVGLMLPKDMEYMRVTFGTKWPYKVSEWLEQCVERDRSDRRLVAEEKAALAEGGQELAKYHKKLLAEQWGRELQWINQLDALRIMEAE